MRPQTLDDPILRESRRAVLARRLISHGLRTDMTGRLTGLTRNRLATVRRRLMVADEMRPRGPVRSALEVFRGPLGRSEGAALASLAFATGLLGAKRIDVSDLLEQAERICDAYEAYRAAIPGSRVELEDFILLYRAVTVGRSLLADACRSCRCMSLLEPFEGRRDCWHCSPRP